MIRVVLFLVVVGALAVGAAWLADRPGDVVVTWQGLRIETSLMVLGGAVLVLMDIDALKRGVDHSAYREFLAAALEISGDPLAILDDEFRFRQAFPQIFKVSIHAEPRGH